MSSSGVPAVKPFAILDLTEKTRQACLIARDAVSHALNGLINGSPASLHEVRACEEKLDDLDRELDEELASTITQVDPARVRELLASMKIMLDLERIGDLIASFAERSAILRNRLEMEDVEQLTRMACLVENMLAQIGPAITSRDIDEALRVLRSDSEIDRMRNLLVVRHTENPEGLKAHGSLHVLAMATALERAGDHIKNMAEEVCHLATGHTLRHVMRSKDKPLEQLFIDWLAKQK
ncbi:MAG TPA: PhoU domain-containing protein [Candidatus Angelobacter sp.]|nr:PhoU domain-containing protein [Candidatus Angelobacter sp.]